MEEGLVELAEWIGSVERLWGWVRHLEGSFEAGIEVDWSESSLLEEAEVLKAHSPVG